MPAGISAEWEKRLADLWASIGNYTEEKFLARMETLVGELASESAVAAFERASSLDSTGHSSLAVPLYQEALERGLTGPRRRRAVTQMASSLRSIGRAPESVALLSGEREAGSDELDDAVVAFLALALVDVGRERKAVSLSLSALAGHLPRYQRSLANYAQQISEQAGRPHLPSNGSARLAGVLPSFNVRNAPTRAAHTVTAHSRSCSR